MINQNSTEKDMILLFNQIEAANEYPMKFGEDAALKNICLLSNLIDAGFLQGAHMEDETGVPVFAAVTGIPIAGREYIEKLKNQEFKKSIRGRLFTFLKYLGAGSIGIILTLVTQLILKGLGLI